MVNNKYSFEKNNVELNIASWNVNWFLNYKSPNGLYREEKIDLNAMDGILEFVKDYLKKENSFVFLNEVPYRNRNNRWRIHECFEMFRKSLEDEGYTVILNENACGGHFVRATVCICKNESYICKNESTDDLNADDKSDKTAANKAAGSVVFPEDNRIAENNFEGIKIYGVHMSTGRTFDENQWKKLIESSREGKCIIVGDFNAYVNCKDQKTRESYEKLMQNMVDVLPDNTVTFGPGRTAIDHILVSKDLISTENLGFETSVQRNFKNSDHKWVSVKVDLNIRKQLVCKAG